MTVGTVAALLNKRVASEVDQRIHLFMGDSVLTASSILISDLYNTYKDPEDGLLYVSYSNEIPPNTPQLGHYKVSYTHKERMQDAEKALWLEKVPIICEKKEGSSIPAINQRKFFVSQEITVGKLIELLKDRIAQEVDSPIYIFVRGDFITNYDEPIMEVYEGYKDTDKFLYVTYSNTRN
jgi:GABA(A) receptor-associated protein